MRGLTLLQGILKHLLVRYLEFAQLREVLSLHFQQTFLNRIVDLSILKALG